MLTTAVRLVCVCVCVCVMCVCAHAAVSTVHARRTRGGMILRALFPGQGVQLYARTCMRAHAHSKLRTIRRIGVYVWRVRVR